jgi:hypothetical protein
MPTGPATLDDVVRELVGIKAELRGIKKAQEVHEGLAVHASVQETWDDTLMRLRQGMIIMIGSAFATLGGQIVIWLV